ncbi:peptidase S8/S53 domain-containing protein [Choanephora cucurbitarum]|nr:peptidase S8/S53 domain-containing protein [Choanephora cucurbitarum]
MGIDLLATDAQTALPSDAIKDIQVGNFKAVSGAFHPSFISYLSQLEAVDYIEPNQIFKSTIEPMQTSPKPFKSTSLRSVNNRNYKRSLIVQTDVPSWGLSRINHRERDNPKIYTADEYAGKDIHVYVFDSGIDANHPDFGNRAIMEANFVDKEESVDLAGHGTHVAGTIGGEVFGVAKNALLHGIKILDRKGDGTTASLLRAISYVAKTAIPGRSIINLSLTGPRSQVVDDALSSLVRDYNIPVFVSAGNSGDDSCNYSPSSNPDVFTVGAMDEHDMIPFFSSYGACVSIYAPGRNITSSWINSQVRTMDGTSMANPHVSGIAAVLLSQKQYDNAGKLYKDILTLASQNMLNYEVDDLNRPRALLAYQSPF